MHLIIFGDSIAQGFFDTKNGGWATLLSEHLQKQTIESDYEIYNSVFNQSISGENTTEILNRFENEIHPRLNSGKKNIIVFAGGINDAKRLLPSNELYVPIETTKRNLETFIDKAKELADDIFVIGLIRVNEEFTTNYNSDTFLNSDIKEYDEMIKAYTEVSNVKYVVMSDVINHEHLEDGLHPNAEGHRLMFERIKETLEAEGIL